MIILVRMVVVKGLAVNPNPFPRRGGNGVKLSGVGFLEHAHRVRRGERGVEWMGGPLWSPAVPLPKKTYLCKVE